MTIRKKKRQLVFSYVCAWRPSPEDDDSEPQKEWKGGGLCMVCTWKELIFPRTYEVGKKKWK